MSWHLFHFQLTSQKGIRPQTLCHPKRRAGTGSLPSVLLHKLLPTHSPELLNILLQVKFVCG